MSFAVLEENKIRFSNNRNLVNLKFKMQGFCEFCKLCNLRNFSFFM